MRLHENSILQQRALATIWESSAADPQGEGRVLYERGSRGEERVVTKLSSLKSKNLLNQQITSSILLLRLSLHASVFDGCSFRTNGLLQRMLGTARACIYGLPDKEPQLPKHHEGQRPRGVLDVIILVIIVVIACCKHTPPLREKRLHLGLCVRGTKPSLPPLAHPTGQANVVHWSHRRRR